MRGMPRWLVVFAVLLAPLFAGCIGNTPSPLAPKIGGSIGVPGHGMLTNAVPLPYRGDAFGLLRKNARNFGNPRIISAIEGASRVVAKQRPGGARLMVGDISQRWGGGSSGHASHRTGRDADLLPYLMTLDGAPVQSPGFLHIGPDGLARTDDGKFYRLDVERTWLLVKALVTSKQANVQWLFFARWLEALVIEYARARGEDPEVVWIAESTLLQPGDSANHDDHLHLRIACTPEEAVSGCLGGGPYWPWLPPLPQLAAPPDQELAQAIAGDLLPKR